MAFAQTKAIPTTADSNEQVLTGRFERHFSVKQLAELWNLSPDSVRRLLLHEPGVVVLQKIRAHRRTYKTLRIPESVATRVYRLSTVL
jgi:hypothetical protein